MMLLIRSLVFQVWMYGLMALLGVLFSPMALWSREGAYAAIGIYLKLVFWGMRAICGLTFVVRGTPPTGEALVISKHQSFLDILILLHAMPAAKFVMKRSLVWAPIVGFYALRIGASPVTRGKGAESLTEMMAGVARRRNHGGQLVIFPQGTRVPPGEARPYKYGAFALYESYGAEAWPVALDTGRFWPRIGLARRPGVAALEFLEPIPPGLSGPEFMARMEQVIETGSDSLAREDRGG